VHVLCLGKNSLSTKERSPVGGTLQTVILSGGGRYVSEEGGHSEVGWAGAKRRNKQGERQN